MSESNRTAKKSPKADQVLLNAQEQARQALLESEAADYVGDFLGTIPEEDRVLTFLFDNKHPGYLGWRWAVTVARAPRSQRVTVSEINVLAGDDSVVSPAWVPWAERLTAWKEEERERLESGLDIQEQDDEDLLLEDSQNASDDADEEILVLTKDADTPVAEGQEGGKTKAKTSRNRRGKASRRQSSSEKSTAELSTDHRDDHDDQPESGVDEPVEEQGGQTDSAGQTSPEPSAKSAKSAKSKHRFFTFRRRRAAQSRSKD